MTSSVKTILCILYFSHGSAKAIRLYLFLAHISFPSLLAYLNNIIVVNIIIDSLVNGVGLIERVRAPITL